MMNYSDAVKRARKYGIPGPKQFVKMPVEVALAYIDLNDLEVLGWRDGYLVVRPLPNPPHQKSIDGEGVDAEGSEKLSVNGNQLEDKEEAHETYPF